MANPAGSPAEYQSLHRGSGGSRPGRAVARRLRIPTTGDGRPRCETITLASARAPRCGASRWSSWVALGVGWSLVSDETAGFVIGTSSAPLTTVLATAATSLRLSNHGNQRSFPLHHGRRPMAKPMPPSAGLEPHAAQARARWGALGVGYRIALRLGSRPRYRWSAVKAAAWSDPPLRDAWIGSGDNRHRTCPCHLPRQVAPQPSVSAGKAADVPEPFNLTRRHGPH